MFVGRDTLLADAYPMKSEKQFVNTLEDNVRRRGALDKFLSGSAKTEISNKIRKILKMEGKGHTTAAMETMNTEEADSPLTASGISAPASASMSSCALKKKGMNQVTNAKGSQLKSLKAFL